QHPVAGLADERGQEADVEAGRGFGVGVENAAALVDGRTGPALLAERYRAEEQLGDPEPRAAERPVPHQPPRPGAKAAPASRATSSGGTSRRCWSTAQRCPNGSMNWPVRSPQNASCSGSNTVAPAASARRHTASASPAARCSAPEVPPRVSGGPIPPSGNSPLMARTLSPNCSSIVRICPPGSVIRLVSAAPSTDTYQAAARAGSRVTRWLVKVPMNGYHTGCLDELSRHVD